MGCFYLSDCVSIGKCFVIVDEKEVRMECWESWV